MKTRYIIAALAALTGLVSCDKFLDTMPDNRAEVDTKAKVRALLTSGYPTATYLTLNEYMSDNVDNIGDDNPGTERFFDQLYSWQDVTELGIHNDGPDSFWGKSWLCIAHANQGLDAIYQLTGTTSIAQHAEIAARGFGPEMAEALLIRAYNHFMLVNEFCLNYNKETSGTDLGIPYMEQVEQELNPKYDRGNVAEVYAKIERDLELALQYVSDAYYSVPKYHFNTRAAYAFAARFYLFYEKWEKAAEYASKCVGSQPASVLRNLLMLTSYSSFAYYFCYPGITKYSHDSYLAFTETQYARQIWSTTSGYDAGQNYYLRPGWYNGSTYDQVSTMKIPYMFEYTDPVARIGYSHAVCPAFTTDEALLTRAEAKVMQHLYDEATVDINTYIHSIVKRSVFSTDLTTEQIVDFYSNMAYWAWNAPTLKKKLNPAFNIGADGGIQESMLQCILNLKRLDHHSQGLRWYDVKRYGIEIHRRTMEPDPKAGDYDAALKPLSSDDILTVNDPRRAMQLPQEVLTAGMEPNPRGSSTPSGMVANEPTFPYVKLVTTKSTTPSDLTIKMIGVNEGIATGGDKKPKDIPMDTL